MPHGENIAIGRSLSNVDAWYIEVSSIATDQPLSNAIHMLRPTLMAMYDLSLVTGMTG